MSKKAIVSSDGIVAEIVEAGDKFDIYEGPDAKIKWVDVPDDIDLESFALPRCYNGVFVDADDGEDCAMFLQCERVRSYLSFGEQLDMQYRDQMNGTTEWKDHITAVKAANAKPSTGKDNYPHPAPREEPQWEKID